MALLRHGTLFVGISVIALSGCATVPTGLSEGGRRYQEEAQRFERDGRLRESLERWKIVLAIDPQHPGANQKRTELEAKIQEKARLHVAAGKELLQRKEKQGAQRELLAALRLDPVNRETLELLYQSEQQLGEQTAYARPLRKGGVEAKSGDVKSSPAEEYEEEDTGEEVSFAEAAEIFRRGDYLAAIEAFNRVLAQQPGLREAIEYQKLAYYNQGLAYMKGESYVEALRMFERVRKIQPDFKRVSHEMQTAREKLADQHYLAGIRQYKEKKLKEAIEEWDQALALNPKLENARRSKEKARSLLKSLEEIK